MIISDLNYLETTQTEVFGGFTYPSVSFKETVKINKYINSKVNLKGNVATAESDAEAYGKDSLAQIFTYTKTTPYSSYSSGTSISASN